MKTSSKIDAYRLAWLPIAFLAEQDDSSEPLNLLAGLEHAYRDVATIALWVYMLHTYHGLVRRRFGGETERLVRLQQKEIFSDEKAAAGEAIESALCLVDDALRVGVIGIPFQKTRFEIPAELRVSLALLLGLPESPDYMKGTRRETDRVVHRTPGIDWQLAGILLRGQQTVLKVFGPVFEKIDPLLEPPWSH